MTRAADHLRCPHSWLHGRGFPEPAVAPYPELQLGILSTTEITAISTAYW